MSWEEQLLDIYGKLSDWDTKIHFAEELTKILKPSLKEKNMAKMYEMKKNMGSGRVVAKVVSVGDYKGRSTAWCDLNDGGKYDEKKVNVTNKPRELTQADVGKSFEFDIATKQNGQYVNLYAQVVKEVSQAKAQEINSQETRGKCMCQVICAGISSGQLDCRTLDDIVAWVDLMMGKEDISLQGQKDMGCSDENPFDDRPATDEDIPFGA